MKKLIALFAASTVASTAAVAGVALSGTASVSYDDNGSAASSTTYDADLLFTGTSGGTTVTVGQDVNGANAATTSAVLTSEIGMLTVSADMFVFLHKIGTISLIHNKSGNKINHAPANFTAKSVASNINRYDCRDYDRPCF